MKILPTFLAMTAVIGATVILGCAPALKSSKLEAPQEQSRTEQPSSEQGIRPEEPASAPEARPQGKHPPVPGSPVGREDLGKPAPPATHTEVMEKQEVNKAALEFAKEMPDVLHVKTCYSKMFGGWYLDLFLKKGKKKAIQHYTWNPTTKEWEVSLPVKEVTDENLDYYLKGQVGDEKCTVLK
jgi:hypothetical protein